MSEFTMDEREAIVRDAAAVIRAMLDVNMAGGRISSQQLRLTDAMMLNLLCDTCAEMLKELQAMRRERSE
jgi:predicted alpha/beta-fold hydrolase